MINIIFDLGIQHIPSLIFTFFYWSKIRFAFIYLEYEFIVLWIATSVFCILINISLLIQCIISMFCFKKDDIENDLLVRYNKSDCNNDVAMHMQLRSITRA